MTSAAFVLLSNPWNPCRQPIVRQVVISTLDHQSRSPFRREVRCSKCIQQVRAAHPQAVDRRCFVFVRSSFHSPHRLELSAILIHPGAQISSCAELHIYFTSKLFQQLHRLPDLGFLPLWLLRNLALDSERAGVTDFGERAQVVFIDDTPPTCFPTYAG